MSGLAFHKNHWGCWESFTVLGFNFLAEEYMNSLGSSMATDSYKAFTLDSSKGESKGILAMSERIQMFNNPVLQLAANH